MRTELTRRTLILLYGWVLAFGLALTAGPAASANYETVGTFNDPLGQEILVRSGVAVNLTGNGGVNSGAIYEVGRLGAGGVSRYSEKGVPEGHWGAFNSNFGVAVEQSTGNVYVLRPEIEAGGNVVKVFSADGAKEVTSFGEKAPAAATINESPEKIHRSPLAGGIAIDAVGRVYVVDEVSFLENRIMVFEPETPGDFEHYVYAGRANDIAVGITPNRPGVDAAGNIYVVGAESAIYEFAPGNPKTPICEYQLATGGIVGMTVDPLTGEVFYFSSKNKQIHQLSACNSEGEFVENVSPFSPVPKLSGSDNIEALAFNPTLAWEPSRAAGVLYGLAASNNTANPNYIFAPAVSHEPVVESESVSHVTSSTATLKAQINPKGSQTTYIFQYLTDAAYQANEPSERFAGASEAPAGGASLGNGQSPLPASVSISGLLPDTEYHYRVRATSPEGSDDGADLTFKTFPIQAPGPPDSRAYELVSPVQKNGGEVFPANPFASSCGGECKPGSAAAERFPIQSAPDGGAVAYQGFSFSPSEGSAVLNEYLSRRTVSGWQTTNLTPPLYQANLESGYKAFDTGLTTSLIYQNRLPVLSPLAPNGYPDLYSQPTDDLLALSPLLTDPPPNRPEGEVPEGEKFHLKFAGATPDLSRVIFAANDALTGTTPFAPPSVDKGPGKDNLYESALGQLRLVNVLPGNIETSPGAVFGSGTRLAKEVDPTLAVADDFSHAISEDGSRVFWSSEAGQVYVRENGETTQEIPDHSGRFLTASADGSKLLLSDGKLYNVDNLAEAPAELAGKAAFKGILGQSDDLSSIYFVDSADNLHLWHEGSAAFIGALTAEDREDWTVSPIRRTAEASRDGNWLTFLSRAQLDPGYDNTGPCGLNNSQEIVPGPCPEVYLFDSTSESLICASCDPSGEPPLGAALLPTIGVNASAGFQPQPRYLTDQGRLFFDTRDSLSPFDINSGVEDVYEYEPQGVGSCLRKGGCASLISAGSEPVDSNFLAIDPTAANVFFTSRDQLVSRDHDELLDVYDAREFGGFPDEGEEPPEECRGEVFCSPSPPAQSEPQSGSSAPQEGNPPAPKPKPCPKGKVRRNGKCVKKAKHHKRARHHRRAAGESRGAAK